MNRENSKFRLIAGGGCEYCTEGECTWKREATRKKHGWMVMWNRKEANQLQDMRSMDSSDGRPPEGKNVGRRSGIFREKLSYI